MGQGGSTPQCGCVESILTGSTKREQFLEQQCTELARQNELLRNRLEAMAQGRSGDPSDGRRSVVRQNSGNLRHRGSLMSSVGRQGSNNNLVAAAAPASADLYPVAEGSPAGKAARRRSERSSTRMQDPGQLATLAVAAAAQEVADYQSSLVSVSINNEAYETRTEVTNP